MTDVGSHGYRAVPSADSEDHSSFFAATAGEDELSSTTGLVWAVVQTKWTYFLLGCALMMPFSALFNATSFFLSRLAGSTFYPTFGSYLSTVYTWTKLVSQFYYTFTSKRSSPSRRIYTSLTAMILLVASLCYSTFVRETPSSFFAFALFVAACMAVAASCLCTAVYAGAAFLGPSFLRSVLAGQAAVSLVVSIVQVASAVIALWGLSPASISTKLIVAGGRDDRAEEVAARIFFAVSAVFLVIALVAYVWLSKQPFYKYITAALERDRGEVSVSDEHTELVPRDHIDPTAQSFWHVFQVFGRNWIFLFSVSYVFIVTLAVYPAITARVRPVNPGAHPLLFTAFHFLFMNFGGFVGQYSCSFPRLVVWSGKKILAMSLLRTVFIPLILLCNVERPMVTPGLPLIRSDALFLIVVLTMGYTTGYVSTLALLAVSSVEHNPRLKGRREDVDVAATLGGSCMILGLAFGALSSFGVQAMI